MKKPLLLVGAMCLALTSLAQQPLSHIRCATTNYLQHREVLQPGYTQSTNQTFMEAKTAISNKSEEEYVIPVVVHIVYKNDSQNLHDSIIHNQILTLNEDYNRLNADTVNLRSIFSPLVGSTKIKFKLASFDPDGNPTNGITRTQTTKNTFAGQLFTFLGGDMSDMEQVKSTANGGIDPWDQTRYLNIWVCNMAFNMANSETTLLMGYATPPSNLPNWPTGSTDGLGDGVVIQYQVFGSNNTAMLPVNSSEYDRKGRTLTHEVGHYLGLRHIWGDGNCLKDDGIDDTPNANGSAEQQCDPSRNSCVDNILGTDLPDMLENFMDYSKESCQNSFTKKQIELMRSVIENHRSGLISNNPALGTENALRFQAQLIPNPAVGQVTITTSKELFSELELIDLTGKVIRRYSTQGQSTTIDVNNLPSGIYQIRYHDDGFNFSQKLIKL